MAEHLMRGGSEDVFLALAGSVSHSLIVHKSSALGPSKIAHPAAVTRKKGTGGGLSGG